ncbi:hypothetical protein KYC5002_50860 [Archangium violaceum]|uniref:hypothetical protein n=1 Tax=Archangium violaceum TaxID=83451 RepID=UPI002B28AE90|nr:hypothetical protein KYC5002_50860 [Archangium gephyra]
MFEKSCLSARFLAGALSAVMLSACGGQEPQEVSPGSTSDAETSAPAVTYEEHMANVRGFLAEAPSGGSITANKWTDYPRVNPYCGPNNNQCRNIAWVGGTENLEHDAYNYNISYSYVVFRNRWYGQSQDPSNFAYVTAAFAALGNSSCDGDDVILSFYDTRVTNSSPSHLRIKKDAFWQNSDLWYIVWKDGWIDMCKGVSYPDAQEFKY